MKIIDAHAHMEVYSPLGIDDNPQKVLNYMDMAGIDRACISTYTNYPGMNPESIEYYEECRKKYMDRFIPYLRMDPGYGEKAVNALKLAVEKYNFKGVKLHPVDYSLAPFEETTIELLNMAAYYDIPVLYHCSDEMMCLPLEIEWAAEQCPKTKIVLGHMGGFFHQEDALNVAKRNENVFLETCEQPYSQSIKRAVKEIGSERILFGTDMPTDNPILEVKKIKLAGLKMQEEENIFYNNIAKILKL